jgi:hypothetical protein
MNMPKVISKQGRERISDFEQEIYESISDSIVKYILGKEWLNAKEISKAIISACNDIKNDEIDKDVGYELLKYLVADYVEHELNLMLDKHFMSQRYPKFDYGQVAFSERLLKGLT